MRLQALPILLIFLLTGSRAAAQDTAEVVRIETSFGNILIWLFDETPRHKASFIQLARAGYFDSLTFNRVIPGFVVQGGCPDTEAGFTDPEYLLQPEFISGLKHTYGAVGAGRDDNPDKLSARCQFYIVHNKEGIPRLDYHYTIFGRVIQGMEVVDRIAHLPRDTRNEPLTPVTLSVSVIKLPAAHLKNMGFQPE